MRRALDILRSARFAAALPCPEAVACIRAQTGLGFDQARARSGFTRGHLLDIVLYLPGGSGARHESDAAEDLVRLLIGEELFERWVGNVSATPTVRGGPLAVINKNSDSHSALPLQVLLDTVRAATAGLTLGLPTLPVSTTPGSADWVVFELEPEPAPDYAAQDDLAICSTRVPEPKKSFLRGEPFFSGRFAKSETLFTYLKYESSELPSELRLRERSKFEECATQSLAPEAGVLVGLGLGLRYSYLDFALRDPDALRERVLPALRAAGMPQRAWWLFCDSELERESIPVHTDSPDPYLR